MSVYTVVSNDDVARFLERYRIGGLRGLRGINEGIENTNYFVDTDRGGYVLTLFEWLNPVELPYFLDLMAHVADAGLPCPHPVADLRGDYLQELAGRPAVLITRLFGHTITTPDAKHCALVGDALAKLHLVMRNFNCVRANGRGLDWCREQSLRVLPQLNREESELMRSEIAHQKARQADEFCARLPRGTVHADLFRDNVLFDGGRLTGLIDFYYACENTLIYDVAVTVNDWCRRAGGALDPVRCSALLAAYRRHREFEPAEHRAWQDALRCAALRFWLSRLCDKLFPRDGEITHVKDPNVLRDILLKSRAGVMALPRSHN